MPDYSKSVSDMSPPQSPGNSVDKRDKLMSTTAVENADNVSATNIMEQYTTKKSSGAFGTLGKRGIAEF